jgi:hypothetical protein
VTAVVKARTDAQLVAEAARLARHAAATGYGTYTTPPIYGGAYDQEIPAGTSNPYWEIVRRMPTRNFYGSSAEPDGSWMTNDVYVLKSAHDFGLDRSALCARYAWSVPTPGDITWLVGMLDGCGVVEIGAGSGYWAWQMAQAGIDVIAYDPEPPGPENRYNQHRVYHPVQIGDALCAADHPDRALFLCWPSYGDPWAAQALAAYRGDLLLFAGEGGGGCTADDDFFAMLDKDWEEVSSAPRHVTYWGIHCRLGAWTRKADQ